MLPILILTAVIATSPKGNYCGSNTQVVPIHLMLSFRESSFDIELAILGKISAAHGIGYKMSGNKVKFDKKNPDLLKFLSSLMIPLRPKNLSIKYTESSDEITGTISIRKLHYSVSMTGGKMSVGEDCGNIVQPTSVIVSTTTSVPLKTRSTQVTTKKPATSTHRTRVTKTSTTTNTPVTTEKPTPSTQSTRVTETSTTITTPVTTNKPATSTHSTRVTKTSTTTNTLVTTKKPTTSTHRTRVTETSTTTNTPVTTEKPTTSTQSTRVTETSATTNTPVTTKKPTTGTTASSSTTTTTSSTTTPYTTTLGTTTINPVTTTTPSFSSVIHTLYGIILCGIVILFI